MPTMRDVCWTKVYDIAKNDRNVLILSSDFGAPALDRFRVDLQSQYINTGISEQNTVLTATGLALEGKKVFITSMSCFITLRCLEQIRLYPVAMKLPITIVGVGAGVSYEDSGTTHHSVEDLSIFRMFPGMKTFNAADNTAVKSFIDMCMAHTGPSYLRLDRAVLPDVHNDGTDFSGGFVELLPVEDITILATGNTVSKALSAAEKLRASGTRVGVVDACVFPLDEEKFIRLFSGCRHLVTWEEHTLPGGLGGSVCEIVCDHRLPIQVKRFGFDFSGGYSYDYGGRDIILEKYGLDEESVIRYISGLKGA